MKIKIKSTDMGMHSSYHDKEVEVEVITIKYPDGLPWDCAGRAISIIEKEESTKEQVYELGLFGQEMKSINIEFK